MKQTVHSKHRGDTPLILFPVRRFSACCGDSGAWYVWETTATFP